MALGVAVAALLACAWIASTASAATIVVDGDDPGSDLDGCGGLPDAPAGARDACNTIQGGIDAAGNGDTVQVEPSSTPYAEAVTIAKPLRLAGPREGIPGAARDPVPDLSKEAVIDAPDDAAAAVTVTTMDVQIDGLFFSGKAALDTDSFPGVSLLGADGEVVNNVMVDHVPGVRVTGANQLIARNSFIQDLSQARFHGVIADSPVSNVTVLENRFDEAGVPVAFADDFAKTGIGITDNSLHGRPGGLAMDLAGLTDSTVRGNSVSGGGDGIQVRAADGLRLDANTIRGAPQFGIALYQHLVLPASTGVEIVRNQLIGNGSPVTPGGAAIAVGTASLGGDLVVVANRFAGQAENGAPGLRVETHQPGPRVLAADNWWGCNGGPGAPGCDAVERLDVEPAVVTAPWLVLRAGALPTYTAAPGALRLSAGIQLDSAGREVPETAPLEELPFEFLQLSGPGSVPPPDSTVGGGANTVIESDEAGLAVVQARLDSAFANITVEFTRPRAAPSPSATPAAPAADLRPPWMRRLRVLGRAFRFDLSEPARVTFSVERAVRDRRSKATRFAPSGAFAMSRAAGSNSINVPVRVGKRRLRPGRYRATLLATDAAGNSSHPKRVAFRVLPKK